MSKESNKVVETQRIIIRDFRLDDLDNLVNLDSDPEVMRYTANNWSAYGH